MTKSCPTAVRSVIPVHCLRRSSLLGPTLCHFMSLCCPVDSRCSAKCMYAMPAGICDGAADGGWAMHCGRRDAARQCTQTGRAAVNLLLPAICCTVLYRRRVGCYCDLRGHFVFVRTVHEYSRPRGRVFALDIAELKRVPNMNGSSLDDEAASIILLDGRPAPQCAQRSTTARSARSSTTVAPNLLAATQATRRLSVRSACEFSAVALDEVRIVCFALIYRLHSTRSPAHSYTPLEAISKCDN